MKTGKIMIMASLLLVGGLSQMACNSWLDVRPETEIPKKELFKTQGGFEDALIGAYIRMSEDNLYGGKLIWEDIEYLAQHWEYSINTIGESYGQYNFKDQKVESSMGGIYNNLYKVIADVNAILMVIDGKQGIFDEGYYELIKGEALAIRAFCHFDLLRLWGPMPEKVVENSGKMLPYVKTIEKVPHPHQTYAGFVAFLEEDLNVAEACLAKVDPINKYPIGSGGQESFLYSRYMRMNYNSVLALRARAYLWMGNNGKALEYARKVIEMQITGGSRQYRLGTGNDIDGNKNYILPSECVLGMFAQKLDETAKKNFMGSSAKFSMKETELNAAFFAGGTTDIRRKLWTKSKDDGNPAEKYVIKKYWQDGSGMSLKTIPLIRLAEMYLIVIERAPGEEANLRYREFCESRAISFEGLAEEPSGRLAMIMDEYHKEFYAEGQAFYAYKRLGVKMIRWTRVEGSEATYVLPMPKQELITN